MVIRLCSVKGCGGKYYAKGFCQSHYDKAHYRRPENAVRVERLCLKHNLSKQTAKAMVLDGVLLEKRREELKGGK